MAQNAVYKSIPKLKMSETPRAYRLPKKTKYDISHKTAKNILGHSRKKKG